MLKKIKDFYQKQSDIGKIVWLTVAVQAGIILALSFCFFIGRFQIPSGFALGSAIADLNFFLLSRQVDSVLDSGNPRVKAKTLRNYVCRFLLYLSGLVLPALLTYFKIYVLDTLAVFGAYIVPKIVLYLSDIRRRSS